MKENDVVEESEASTIEENDVSAVEESIFEEIECIGRKLEFDADERKRQIKKKKEESLHIAKMKKLEESIATLTNTIKTFAAKNKKNALYIESRNIVFKECNTVE